MVSEIIKNAGELYINCLTTESVAASNLITVKVGQCRDSSNVNDIFLNAEATIDPAKTGINGIDNGQLSADAIYHIYAVGDSTLTKATGAILSLETETPNIPGGYDMYRWIGWAKFVSSVLVQFKTLGESSERKLVYDTDALQLTAGASTTLADVDLSAWLGDRSSAVSFVYTYIPAAGANTANIRPFGALTDYVVLQAATGETSRMIFECPVYLNGSNIPIISYLVDAGDTLSLGIRAFDFFI